LTNVSRSTLDFSPVLEDLQDRAGNLEAIVAFLATNQLDHFIQQLAQSGLDLPLVLSGVGMDPETVNELGGVHGPIYSFAYEHAVELQNPANHRLQEFAREYRIAVGYHRIDTLGPWIYDGILLLHELMATVTSPEELRQELGRYQGRRLIGLVSFDADGTIDKQTFVPVRIDDGFYRPLELDR